MRKSQSSMTASGIAIVRALESEKPATERICYDPYARQFVGSALYHFVRFFDRLGYSEKRGPGVMGFLIVRERYIDDYLKTGLAQGVRQVIILGAGFDARAYRFEEFQHGVKVFEVDHPATQQAKTKRLHKIFGRVPPYVTYVSIDFNTQTLEQRLRECGYDEKLKTLFIWQGVTQYLTPEGVDSTLAFVAHHSGPGSSIIFDYMYTSLLDGTVQHGEVSKMRRDRWMSQEVLAFGIPEGTIASFMQQRGFEHVGHANHQVLHDTYFTGVNAKRTVADGYAIASAVVKAREAR
ncbi:MAG TPA: class I SAM-dependent methyltransferase [Anaerolineae bacterium]|nr:class I SAM-dependent methyltransferase [Anaerolineae bacterium]